ALVVTGIDQLKLKDSILGPLYYQNLITPFTSAPKLPTKLPEIPMHRKLCPPLVFTRQSWDGNKSRALPSPSTRPTSVDSWMRKRGAAPTMRTWESGGGNQV